MDVLDRKRSGALEDGRKASKGVFFHFEWTKKRLGRCAGCSRLNDCVIYLRRCEGLNLPKIPKRSFCPENEAQRIFPSTERAKSSPRQLFVQLIEPQTPFHPGKSVPNGREAQMSAELITNTIVGGSFIDPYDSK